MRIKHPVLLFVLFVFSTICFGQFKLDQPVSLDPSVKIGKLPNGLTYYIRKNAKPEKKVELRLVLNAGSVLEEENQRGLAHFMEHMGFNGSKNFPKNELVSFLQQTGVKFGADLNAYTSFDETVYILPLPNNDPVMVEKGFTILEDWAFNNLMDKAEIEKERGVVLEESRLSKGAQERMGRQYLPYLFNGSRYANRLAIGSDSVLRTFKPETLQRFYKDWYRPDLMAVIVVGDIDPAMAEQKIRTHFSKAKTPPNAPKRPSIIPIKARTSPEALVITDDEATNTVLQIYNYVQPAPKVRTWADYRKTVVEGLVTSLINQRLQELTQKENPPFLFGYTGMSPFIRGYQAFTSFAVLGENSADAAVTALVSETERARRYGFLASELDRAKAVLMNQTERAFAEKDKSESGQIIGQYINHYLQGNPIPGTENRYQFIKQVLPTISLQEVNAFAQQMPASDKSFALITAPTKMKDKLPDNAGLLKSIAAAAQAPVKAYEEKAVAGQLLDKDPVAGKIISEKNNEKLGTTDFTLSNGITVTIKPTSFKNDQILMDAWRWGGVHKYNITDKENAGAAAQMVSLMGVRDISGTDLEKYLAGKTVNVSPYINDHEEGIEGSSSVKDFETFLQLTHLYFTQPRKDETLFNTMVRQQKASIQYVKENPRFFLQDTVMKIVYNNNPWMRALPTEKDFDAMNANRSYEIYREIFSNAHGMHFTFVGNIEPAKAKPLLEKYLGSLPASPRTNAFRDQGIRPVTGVVNANIKKGKDQQSFLNLHFSGEATNTPEEQMALRALMEVMNIKITEQLREEMSGIYGGGFSGNISTRPYVHYTITASVPMGPENVDKLTTALMTIISDAKKGIHQKDLDKVKENWKKQHSINMQSNDAWLTHLSNAWINRTNPENILTYEERVNRLTTEDVRKAAQKYLDLNNYVKVVLYPENANIPSEQKKTF